MKGSRRSALAVCIPMALLLASCRSSNPTSNSIANVLSPAPTSHGGPATSRLDDVVFLHHSVGRNLIEKGNLRQLLTNRGYQLYDQGYNEEDGLHVPDGSRADYTYDVPNDNTDPDGLAAIFSQPVEATSLGLNGAPSNTLSGLLRHNVIIFKSCYPVTQIESDADLERYKTYYLQIRATIDRYPDKVFIALTPPPQDPGNTNREAAARARTFANWMKSSQFVEGHPNLFVVDFFDSLAENDPNRSDYNTLRVGFRDDAPGFRAKLARPLMAAVDFAGVGGNMGRLWMPGDSHPNVAANRAVAPILTDAIDAAARGFSAELAQAAKSL